MEPRTLDDLVKRYEAGDRDPDLLQALNDAAWEGFHDPWEPTLPADPEEGDAMDAETIQPFTAETLQAHFRNKNLTYLRNDEGLFLVFMGYDKPSDRRVQIIHSVEGKRNSVYRLRIVADRRVDAKDYTLARELCNTWNDSFRWPRAFLEIPSLGEGEGEPDSGLLVMDYQLLLDKGIHQALFDDLVESAVSASWDFWKMAREKFGL